MPTRWLTDVAEAWLILSAHHRTLLRAVRIVGILPHRRRLAAYAGTRRFLLNDALRRGMYARRYHRRDRGRLIWMGNHRPARRRVRCRFRFGVFVRHSVSVFCHCTDA